MEKQFKKPAIKNLSINNSKNSKYYSYDMGNSKLSKLNPIKLKCQN